MRAPALVRGRRVVSPPGVIAAGAAMLFAALAPATSAEAHRTARCLGHRATIQGANTELRARGGRRADYLFGGNFTRHDKPTELHGGPGPDYIDGGFGRDRISGGPGDDRIDGEFGSDRIVGTTGDDFIRAQRGGDRIGG